MKPKKPEKTETLDEAMSSMNVASYMKVSGGAMARPRTMLPFNRWEETDEEEAEEFPSLRTGVWSDHGGELSEIAATPERAQLADMGVEFAPKAENGYFDPMAEGAAKDGEAVAVFRQIDPGTGKAHHIEMSAGPYTSLAKLKVAYRNAKAKPAEGQVGVWTAAARQEKVQGGLKWLPASRPIDGQRPKGGKKTEDDGAMSEGSQSWKKLWGKAKADLKRQGGKGPAGKSTLARMDRKQGKAGAEPNPYRDEDPRHTAHKGRRGKKTKGEDEAPGAAILREGKQKLHPSMKKHTNTAKFKAHVGDSDDSEPPFHKGKGIEKKEDAPVSAAVLREMEIAVDKARRGAKKMLAGGSLAGKPPGYVAMLKALAGGARIPQDVAQAKDGKDAYYAARKRGGGGRRPKAEDAPVSAAVLREAVPTVERRPKKGDTITLSRPVTLRGRKLAPAGTSLKVVGTDGNQVLFNVPGQKQAFRKDMAQIASVK